MKFKKENLEKMRSWVEANGLHPEPCGAKIKDFCATFGIDKGTYFRWIKNETFSTLVKESNEVFSKKIVGIAEASLIKLVTGYEEWEEFQEGIPDGNGGVSIKKMTRRKKIVAPNLGAITFLLCNRAPEIWTNPIKVESKTDITSGGKTLQIIVNDEVTKQALDGLANEQNI